MLGSAATVEMPKVTKKSLKDEQGLRPVPTAMETDADDAPSTSGAKIKFAPMSVFDQNGKKIDFRRVSLSTVQQSSQIKLVLRRAFLLTHRRVHFQLLTSL